MGNSAVENSAVESTVEGSTAVQNTTVAEEFTATVRNLNVFDGLALLVALALVGVGYFIGTAGSPPTGSTSSMEFTINPEDAVRPLAPGATALFPVYVNNPNDYGVRVDSISDGKSNATASGCPAATITSIGLNGPAGFIYAGGVRAYEISVTMAGTADSRCKGQTFTLPLTVKLAAAAAKR